MINVLIVINKYNNKLSTFFFHIKQYVEFQHRFKEIQLNFKYKNSTLN